MRWEFQFFFTFLLSFSLLYFTHSRLSSSPICPHVLQHTKLFKHVASSHIYKNTHKHTNEKKNLFSVHFDEKNFFVHFFGSDIVVHFTSSWAPISIVPTPNTKEPNRILILCVLSPLMLNSYFPNFYLFLCVRACRVSPKVLKKNPIWFNKKIISNIWPFSFFFLFQFKRYKWGRGRLMSLFFFIDPVWKKAPRGLWHNRKLSHWHISVELLGEAFLYVYREIPVHAHTLLYSALACPVMKSPRWWI